MLTLLGLSGNPFPTPNQVLGVRRRSLRLATAAECVHRFGATS